MPSSKNEFALYCCELLASIGPCVARRMFGGFGISTEGLTVALMTNLGSGDKLWLKADDESRHQFEAAGCERFTYPVKGVPKSMNYYSAPEDAMEAPNLMEPWARLALEAAVKARALKPQPKAKPAPKSVVKLKATRKPKAG